MVETIEASNMGKKSKTKPQPVISKKYIRQNSKPVNIPIDKFIIECQSNEDRLKKESGLEEYPIEMFSYAHEPTDIEVEYPKKYPKYLFDYNK
tara:strand:- start:362 stop:640 length:279 start_codon:yes stop_codon:yes gene_type:complete